MSTTGWARSTGRDSVPGGGVIWTPDQRLRVFVSSTLRELAAERQAVRDPVTSLRLVPVMFELGARPHPPRDVYRAYLGQSQAFVGIYWQSYGWVAPGEQISGLEDEYWLSAGLPRLIYVKSPAPNRELGLTELLARIQDEGGVSYRHFSRPPSCGSWPRTTSRCCSASGSWQARRPGPHRAGKAGVARGRCRWPSPRSSDGAGLRRGGWHDDDAPWWAAGDADRAGRGR